VNWVFEMSQRIVVVMIMSCLLAFGMAAWVFAAGYGFLMALLAYSFGGSTVLLVITGFAYAQMPDEAMAINEARPAL